MTTIQNQNQQKIIRQTKRILPVSKQSLNQIWWLVHQAQKQKALGFPSIQQRRMKDEMRRLHLINPQTGQASAMMDLKCAHCKREHPDNPQPLLIWKKLLRQNNLKCPYCHNKNFIHANRQKPQGDMMAEAIEKRSTFLRKHIEDEVGSSDEGKKYTRKYGVKVI